MNEEKEDIPTTNLTTRDEKSSLETDITTYKMMYNHNTTKIDTESMEEAYRSNGTSKQGARGGRKFTKPQLMNPLKLLLISSCLAIFIGANRWMARWVWKGPEPHNIDLEAVNKANEEHHFNTFTNKEHDKNPFEGILKHPDQIAEDVKKVVEAMATDSIDQGDDDDDDEEEGEDDDEEEEEEEDEEGEEVATE